MQITDGSQPMQERQALISDAINRLDRLAESSEGLVKELAIRLEPVLRPSTPETEADCKSCAPEGSNIGKLLMECCDRIEASLCSMRETHKRIDL